MKFGIIGYGVMGEIRYNVIKNMHEHCVIKVFEANLERKIPSDIQRVDNYLDILNDEDIDAVFICVPNYLILKYVTESLDAGKHVFCEKPPGINYSQVLEMKKAEKRNYTLKLMFGFNHRHHESIIHAKQVIDSGDLGDLLWMRGRYGKSVPHDFKSNWRSKKEFAGGGIFLDQGIHMLDLFLMMCGNFDEVKAFVSNLYWKSDIEDNVFAIFKNSKGQVASLHSTMTQWRHLFALEIFLEKGHIVINGLLTTSGSYGQEQLTISRNTSSWKHGVSWDGSETRTYNINNSWTNEINTFLNAIETDKPVPMGNSDDASKLMILVDKVYEQK
jgi:predicted dehydrogenase